MAKLRYGLNIDRKINMTNTMLVLVNLKIAAMKQIKEYPATFHAIDLALRIAGWEEASVKGDEER